MSTNQNVASPEELLAHQGFLRGLVRTLVLDHEEAEDYLQETWTYAIRKPPRSGPGLRAWLAVVARNFIRQDRRARGRRGTREAVAARPESTSENAVERERLRRRIVDAVFELKEPDRTAVILRYLDGLPSRDIARRTNAPVETVRSRLKRALATLRKRFDDEHGGDRRAWCMALVPLVTDPKKAAVGTAGLLGGALLMFGKTKIAITVAVVALIVGLTIVLDPTGLPAGPSPERPAERETAPLARAEAERTAPTRAEPIAPPDSPSGEEPVAKTRVGIAFRDSDGRVLTVEDVVRRYREAGIPLVVRVVPESLFRGDNPLDMFRCRVRPTDEWAEFVPLRVDTGSIEVAAPPVPGGYRLFLGRPGAAPLVTGSFVVTAGGDIGVDVHLPLESDTVRVRLVDAETEAALPGARVTPWFEYGDDHLFIPGPARVADSQGIVPIPILSDADRGRGRQPSWWVETETHLGLIATGKFPEARPGRELEMPIPRAAAISGRAWLTNGEPAAGRQIAWLGKGLTRVATVSEDGTFRIAPVAVWDDRGAEVFLVEDLETLQVKQARVQVSPGKTAELTIGTPAGSVEFATIAGRVTAGGRPVPNAYVVTRHVEKGKSYVPTGADGTYEKKDVPAGRVEVSIWFGDPRATDAFFAQMIEPVEMKSGEVHRFDFELPTGAFRVTVVDDETGKPLPGALALARPADPKTGTDRFPGFRYAPGWGLRVGADGTAVLLAMLPGKVHTVTAAADGYEATSVEDRQPGTLDRPEEVTLRLKRK